MRSLLRIALAFALLAGGAALAAPASGAAASGAIAPGASPYLKVSRDRLLELIRLKFRSYRPPPPYVTYTLHRYETNDQGFVDEAWTYAVHVWQRSSDNAALERNVYHDYFDGPPVFGRPEFNQDRDPGPPTADLFEKAPAHPQPISVVPTPEPTQAPLKVIGAVRAVAELEYKVDSVDQEGDELHLVLTPLRDPQRNRLRELWVDAKTLDLRKVIAHDRLFMEGPGGGVYNQRFVITLTMLDGRPVVTDIYENEPENERELIDTDEIHYTFTDIAFPKSLPDWYFNAREYGQHTNELPQWPQ